MRGKINYYRLWNVYCEFKYLFLWDSRVFMFFVSVLKGYFEIVIKINKRKILKYVNYNIGVSIIIIGEVE